jgi:hypothetical protein
MKRTAAISLVSAVAVIAAETPLWRPYYISPRAGDRHVALDKVWEMGATAWRPAPPKSPPSPGG